MKRFSVCFAEVITKKNLGRHRAPSASTFWQGIHCMQSENYIIYMCNSMLLLKVLHNSERHSQVQLLYIQQTKSSNHVSSGHLQEVIKMESYKSPSPKNAHGGL